MNTATVETVETVGIFENRFYTKHELAKILKLSLRSIENRMSDGTLPYKKLGRMVRFSGIELNSI